VLRAPAHRLVDHQIGHQRADPGDGDVAVEAEHALQRLEHAQHHQQHRDQHVEHQPHHPAGVAVRQAGEEVRPGQRAGVGVGHVDLDLRHHHEQHRGRQRPGRRRENFPEGHPVHLRRLDRLVHRHLLLQHEERQEGAAQHLDHARHDPARPRQQHRGPPAARALGRFLGQEAQVVDLLADLHHQRGRHRGRGAEHQPVEAGAARDAAGQRGELGEALRRMPGDGGIGQHQQHHPHRLRPALQPRDQRDAVHHQRHHAERGDQVAQRQRPVERHLDRQRQDGRLQREEDEGEAGVDQRGQRRAQVAEAGAAGQQVHVQPVAGGVVADRQAGEEGDQPDHQDGAERIGEAVAQRDGAADGLQRQEGRGPEGGVAHMRLAPLAEMARRVAQGVVLLRLVGHPVVVVAADAEDLLRGDRHTEPRGEKVKHRRNTRAHDTQEPVPPSLNHHVRGEARESRTRAAAQHCVE